MIELLNSRKMVLLVVGLVGVCIMIIVLEGLFTDDQSWHPLFPAQGYRWQPSHQSSNDVAKALPGVTAKKMLSNGTLIHNNQSNKVSGHELENKQKLESTDFCWLHESHVLVDPCAKCTDQEMRNHLEACSNTGYKERIRCHTSGLVIRSCITSTTSTSHFTTFHICMAFVTLFGYLMLGIRRKQLDAKMYERFRRQLQSGV